MMRMSIVVVAMVVTGPAFGLNMSVFKDAPLTRLTATEVTEYRDTVSKVLDETPDGTTVEWKAPKTQFVSKITPQRSFKDGKFKCREATIESEAHDRFQRGRYTFCKEDKGNWQFRRSSTATKK